MTACPECGYDFSSLDRRQIQRALTSLADEQRRLLESVAADRLRAHPRPGSWSALEYGCHVRDMLRFQRDRVLRAQAEDGPWFGSMRRDERAVEDRYNAQDPRAVVGQLAAAARQLAATLSGLDEAGWLRTGVYPWPTRELRTVEWIGQRTAHELAHHLFDCRRLLAVGEPG
ncbi:MAG TPA: DinB family protein [Streptosporangiaceae bacterium]|nr:DinB family protein [Streptosporangiaceae bacterium]